MNIKQLKIKTRKLIRKFYKTSSIEEIKSLSSTEDKKKVKEVEMDQLKEVVSKLVNCCDE